MELLTWKIYSNIKVFFTLFSFFEPPYFLPNVLIICLHTLYQFVIWNFYAKWLELSKYQNKFTDTTVKQNFCTSAIIYWDENFLRSNFVKHQYKVCVELFLNYCRTAEEYFVQLRLLEFPFCLYFVTRYICLLKN